MHAFDGIRMNFFEAVRIGAAAAVAESDSCAWELKFTRRNINDHRELPELLAGKIIQMF